MAPVLVTASQLSLYLDSEERSMELPASSLQRTEHHSQGPVSFSDMSGTLLRRAQASMCLTSCESSLLQNIIFHMQSEQDAALSFDKSMFTSTK